MLVLMTGSPSSSRSRATTSESLCSKEMDWTMPPLMLKKKAFIKGSDFGKMAVLQVGALYFRKFYKGCSI